MFKILNSNLRFAVNKLNQLNGEHVRSFHVCLVNGLKKIEKKLDKDKNTITIEGKYLDETSPATSAFSNVVMKFDEATSENVDHAHRHSTRPCSLCELEKRGIYVQYKDVLILRQFLTDDGTVLPTKVTGLCYRQQKKVLVMTKHAKIAGLILNLQPKLLDGSEPDTDQRRRFEHLKWNTYFEDYEMMIRKNKYL